MNMLHSLAVYIEKFKNCGYKILKNDRHMVGLQIFEDFIFQVYEPDDLLFFLFARSMLKKEFKIMNRNRSIEDE